MRRAVIMASAAAGLGLFASGLWWATDDIDRVHALIETDHATVAHLSPDAFAKMDQASTLVFDVREAEEFAVSHLGGAIRIDPAMAPDDFEAAFGDRLEGRDAVFYCSVGRRSSIAAERYADIFAARGATAYNLERGIFGWVNEGRPLTSSQGATSLVHPYDAVWGRLVENEDSRSYTPLSERATPASPR